MRKEALPPVTDLAARAVFVRWERLRILYNGILAVVLIVALWGFGSLSRMTEPRFFVYVAIRFVGANICFTLGPVAEIYGRWFLGLRGRLTPLLFAGGTMLAAALTTYSAFWFSLIAAMADID